MVEGSGEGIGSVWRPVPSVTVPVSGQVEKSRRPESPAGVGAQVGQLLLKVRSDLC